MPMYCQVDIDMFHRAFATPGSVWSELVRDDGVNKTLSILILDASSSMRRYGAIPLESVKAHLRQIKNPPDGRKQYCAIVTFHYRPEVLVPVGSAESTAEITCYNTEVGTLLYETVWHVLIWLCEMKELNESPNLKIVIGVFSDGADGRSPESQPAWLKETARDARESGFLLFTYGIGIDAKELARDMGFPDDSDHAFTVNPSVGGIRRATEHFSDVTTMQPWRKKK